MGKVVILEDFEKASEEQLHKNLENINNELGNYKKHKEHHEELVALHKKRLELMEKMSAISDVKNKPLQPAYEFQQDQDWLALHSELLKINSAQERKTVQEEILRIEDVIKKSQDEIDRFEAAMPRITDELKRRGA